MTDTVQPRNDPVQDNGNGKDPARRLGGLNTREILGLTFDHRPLPFLTRLDVFFEGAAHIFAAAPKTGKTTMVRRLAYDWVLDGHRVLVFSEEAYETWQLQLKLLQLEGLGDELIVIDALLRGAEALLEVAVHSPADIIVVDTISNLLDIPNINLFAQAGPRLRQWVSAMRKANKTLLLLHHLNDRGEVAGSRTIRSIVDVLVLYREQDGNEFRRVVTVKSRLLPNTVTFAVDKPGGGPTFEVSEYEGEATLNRAEREVLVCLDSKTPVTVKNVMAKTNFSEAKVKRALLDLQAKKLARNLAPGGGQGQAGQWIKLALDEEEGS